MLPKSPVGRPGLCVSSVQFSPPSVDLKIPPPAPPETSCHSLRCACQNRSEEHTSALQALPYVVCRRLLEKKYGGTALELARQACQRTSDTPEICRHAS